MVNIINEQQQANKELLNEIETLKKQLVDKEEELKLKIWHVTGQPSEDSYFPGHWWYKRLKQKMNGWRQVKNGSRS